MIIWINGTFGGGKTQSAHELQRRAGRGWVCDPELLGFGLHRMVPPGQRTDFQDDPLWRTGVRTVISRLADQARTTADGPSAPIIVPMTMVVPEYFDEIVGGLRKQGHDVRHFALRASPETLRRRLRSCGLGVRGRDQWALEQVDRCVVALAHPRFATGIHTDQLGIADVVETIAAAVDLPLPLPRDSAVRWTMRRLAVQVRHIR